MKSSGFWENDLNWGYKWMWLNHLGETRHCQNKEQYPQQMKLLIVNVSWSVIYCHFPVV